MYWLPTDFAAMSSALTSGRPPPSSVASVRAICDVANFLATWPSIGSRSSRRSKRACWPGRRTQPTNATTAPTSAPMTSRNCARRNSETRDDDPRAQRQLRAEGRVEIRERRHHLQDDDRDQDERERDQDGRIDQRRDRLALHRRDDLRVLDVAAQHRVEVAAALAGEQRAPCRRWETDRRARRTHRTAPCPTAPSRARRRARAGTTATSRAASAGRATGPAACRPSAASPVPG